MSRAEQARITILRWSQDEPRHVARTCRHFGYAVLCALALVYVRARVPETKGQRLEELEALFVKGGSA